jgi:transcriptional regulator with XRE-family HTH domain
MASIEIRRGQRTAGAGSLLRDWRRRRRLSQLDLALESGVSARHLSFIETGRSNPSAEMILRLAEQLDVPLRERNRLLLAAGYAPAFEERGLDAPEMAPVHTAIQQVLDGHDPYPAIVVDRNWDLLAGNHAISLLTDGVDPWLLRPPANCMRLALHPDGLAPRIVNLGQWRDHLLTRLARQISVTGDPQATALLEELTAYPGAAGEEPPPPTAGHELAGQLAVPLRLRHGDDELVFVSIVATFGTAVDVTLAELSIETFLPADAATAEALRRHAVG